MYRTIRTKFALWIAPWLRRDESFRVFPDADTTANSTHWRIYFDR